jgi:ubiquinone/menaquinone biosynthesis C-methylase UbiE
MSQLARRRTSGTHGRIDLVLGDGRWLPFGQHSFDGVLSTFPTEFLARPETIAGIYQVLKPGSRLVVVLQARLTSGGLLTRFIEWLYAITGQRPDAGSAADEEFWQRIGDRFQSAGFVLTFEEVRLKSSLVTVIVCEKPIKAGR